METSKMNFQEKTNFGNEVIRVDIGTTKTNKPYHRLVYKTKDGKEIVKCLFGFKNNVTFEQLDQAIKSGDSMKIFNTKIVPDDCPEYWVSRVEIYCGDITKQFMI